MKPEEEARVKIDKKLNDAGWDIVSRYEYVPGYCVAIKECLMKDKKESDYLLFVDNKAIAVVEAKKEANPLGDDVEKQAEGYAHTPEKWYDVWFDGVNIATIKSLVMPLPPLKEQERIVAKIDGLLVNLQ